MSTTPTTPLRGPAPSLYRYLIDAIESGQAIDFHLRASKTKDGGVEFYIHPATVSGDTQDYITWPAPENENYDFLVNKRNTKEPDVERFKKELREHVEQQKHAPPPSPAAQPTDEAKLREVIEKALKLLANDDNYLDPTFDPVATAGAALDALKSALAPHLSQREPGDSELLDWLDRNRYMVDFNNEGTELNGPGHWQCTDGDHWGTGLHIRAAIKSAQRGEGKP